MVTALRMDGFISLLLLTAAVRPAYAQDTSIADNDRHYGQVRCARAFQRDACIEAFREARRTSRAARQCWYSRAGHYDFSHGQRPAAFLDEVAVSCELRRCWSQYMLAQALTAPQPRMLWTERELDLVDEDARRECLIE